MNASAEQGGSRTADPARWWQRRWLQVMLVLCLLLGAGAVLTAEYLLHNAEPILRKRIVETLSARFRAPVELDALNISLLKGLEVEGRGLRVLSVADVGADAGGGAPPLLSVRRFAFRTSLRSLLHQPTRVRRVEVEGMVLHVPPADERARYLAGWRRSDASGSADLEPGGLTPKIAMVVAELRCNDVRIVLDPGEPARAEANALKKAKAPIEFNIRALALDNLGTREPMLYEADLLNPKPVGEIHVSGHVGPWGGAVAGGAPGDTPLDGSYSFDHADLGTIRGLGGTLSSTGHFQGVLDRIAMDGRTDTPNFSLDISNHPVFLHTHFRAVVDGTSGDTFLTAVQARLESSEFTTSGKIVKLAGQGRDIDLTVDIPHGRMQDFLRLAARTSPPLMNGLLTMHTTLHIPPGPARVPEKMVMAGTFGLSDVRFNNPRLQDRIDGLSARATGHPEMVKAKGERGGSGAPPLTESQMSAHFTLARGTMDVTDVRFAFPGATVLMNGVYSMDGRLFEFRGHVRTEATASEMVGGWKGVLLKPLDHFLAKNGAGVELPIEVSGTQGDVHIGLAPGDAAATPAAMLADVHAKQTSKAEITDARRESALADSEDAAAARAPTLEAAERAHAAAVRHRAEAQRLALSARGSTTAPQ